VKDVSEVNQPNARAAMVTSDYPEPPDSINRRGWPLGIGSLCREVKSPEWLTYDQDEIGALFSDHLT